MDANLKPAVNASWTNWFTATRLALLVVFILLVLFFGVFTGSHSFFYRDFGLFTYPVAQYTRDCFWRGEIPLWNPYNHNGVPFLAQWNTTVCYPPSLLYVLLPSPWSLNLFCLGHLVLAAVSMFLLARRWTNNSFAASVAGLGFALNGLTLNSLIWTSNLAALSWQPLVILTVERAWRRGGRHVAVAALIGAMQMLTGSPEIILFTWLPLALLWLGQVWFGKINALKTFKRFAIVVTLVGLLAAIQLLPFLDLLRYSARSSSAASADAWSMPIWGWANFLVPLFHASRTQLGFFFLDGQSWTLSYYVSLGLMLLALIGLWRIRQARVWWLAGLALLGMSLALGSAGFVYAWLKQIIPVIGIARYPIKFVALTIFAIPLLAAYGLKDFRPGTNRDSVSDKRLTLALTLLLLTAIGLILFAAHRFPKPQESWSATWQSGLMRGAFLVAIALAFIFLQRADQVSHRRFLGGALLVLIALDVITAERHQNPTVDMGAFGPVDLHMPSPPKLGESRAMMSRENKAFFGRASTARPGTYFVGVRTSLCDNCNLLEKIPKVDGFSSLTLKEQSEITAALYGTNSFPERLADFLGVAQVSKPGTLFLWDKRESALPIITIGQTPSFAEPADTLKKITSSDFDPRHTVYLPSSVTDSVALGSPGAKILSQEVSAHRINLTTQSAHPAMVVIAQTFYPNWRAFVDGQPVPLWRANHAFQALQVPSGQHEVKIVYQDRSFVIGASLSIITLLGCSIFLFRSRTAAKTINPAAA